MGEARRRMKLSIGWDETIDLTDPEEMKKARMENELNKHVLSILQKNFPGYMWSSKCEMWVDREINGMSERLPGGIQIKLSALMPPTKCYMIPIGMIQNHNDTERLVRNAGGEILERYGQPRGGIAFDEFEAARPKIILDHKSKVPN